MLNCRDVSLLQIADSWELAGSRFFQLFSLDHRMSERLEASSGKEGAGDDQSDAGRILSRNGALQGYFVKRQPENTRDFLKNRFIFCWNR